MPALEHRSFQLHAVHHDAADHRGTAPALSWRLVQLGLLSAPAREGLDHDLLRNNGGQLSAEEPKLFSKRFLQVIADATNEGLLSLRKAMSLLECGEPDFMEILRSHGLESVYDNLSPA